MTGNGAAAVRHAALAQAMQGAQAAIVARWYENQFAPEFLKRYGVLDALDLGRAQASDHFIQPLLRLLLEYLATGDPRFRDLYLDERLRYAPHRAEPGVRRAFFEELLAADEAAVTAVVPDPAAPAILRELHAPLRGAETGRPVTLLAVGDCLLNEVRVFLRTRCALRGIALDMRCVYFSAAIGRDLSPAEVEALMAETRFDLLAFSFFTYEGLPPYAALLREADALSPAQIDERVSALIGLVERYLLRLRDRTDAPFLVHNVSGLPLTRYRKRLPFLAALSRGRRRVVDALNKGMAELAGAIPNVLLVDEDRVARDYGLRAASRSAVPHRLARGAYFHTARFGEPLADEYATLIGSYADLRKAKVLFVDFDHTLWDGVMADGPVRHRTEAQKLLRRLKDAGMLLVALSKNDPKNIRWDEMALAPDDFVLQKISWNLKVQGIEEAAAELDLGMDSFVLLDDSPQERALIAERFPKVVTLDGADPRLWGSLERLFRFPNTRDTDEAKARTEMYRAQARRREAQNASNAAADYPAMMASLGLRLKFGRAVAKDLDRLTELVQRTNQFNTTTIRYTRDELAALMGAADRGIYVAELIDKHGSFGLVGVVIVSRGVPAFAIDAFVMSCRAMGFGLEQALLRLVIADTGAAGPVTGKFIPTDRNAPSARLFADNGFAAAGEQDWRLDDPAGGPAVPAWLKVESRG